MAKILVLELLDDNPTRSEQRYAMLRIFGGTFLAFMALLSVAAFVRPDLMDMMVGMVRTIMP